MKATISGLFLNVNSYHSNKKNCDIPVLNLFDGDDTVRVDDIPVTLVVGKIMGDPMTVPVKIFSGIYGMRITYCAPAEPAAPAPVGSAIDKMVDDLFPVQTSGQKK